MLRRSFVAAVSIQWHIYRMQPIYERCNGRYIEISGMNHERTDTEIVKRIPQVLKRRPRKAQEGRQFTIQLDQASVERLERLKDKFRSLDDSTLIAFALKFLERQTFKIIIKRVLRKIRALEKQGFSSRQMADLLNKQGTPVPGRGHPWDPETIASFSAKIKL
jgi:hypothetical protein